MYQKLKSWHFKKRRHVGITKQNKTDTDGKQILIRQTCSTNIVENTRQRAQQENILNTFFTASERSVLNSDCILVCFKGFFTSGETPFFLPRCLLVYVYASVVHTYHRNRATMSVLCNWHLMLRQGNTIQQLFRGR